jgi:cyanate permease
MKKYSSIFEVWTLEIRSFSEAWRSALGAFALSCLLAFFILISAPDFSHRSVPPHLSDTAHPIQLSTKTSQLSTAFKVNQASKNQ